MSFTDFQECANEFHGSCLHVGVQAHLSRPLLQALRRLLPVLLSCAGGLDLLLRDTIAVGALLKALDPVNDPYGPPLPMDQEPARCA